MDAFYVKNFRLDI